MGAVSSTTSQGSRGLCQIFGTSEAPSPVRRYQTGPLSLLYTNEAIRRISWNQTEIIRGITWPIRNKSWGTFVPEIRDEMLIEADGRVSGRLKFAVADGGLISELEFAASGDGEVEVHLTMTPTAGSFETNRAGLTVLHPIRGLAGSPVQVRHPGEATEASEFPRHISPDQPVKDIAGLAYEIGNVSVEIGFAGEVFEMEDQRNWSDASFKTYCVPLKFPFTYALDRQTKQSVRISVSGGGSGSTTAQPAGSVTVEPTGGVAPSIGIALEQGWGGNASTLDATTVCGANHLLVRVTPSTDQAFLTESADLARRLGAEIDVELVLSDESPPEETLHAAAEALSSSGLAPTRLIALRNAYLASHQPSGPWPDGPGSNDVLKSTRRAFPNVQIGGGVLTNFTEFNRCRPDPELCDFITHGSTAIVHAGDDLSVVETLEALPHIYESTQSIGGGKPYRLGLVSIGMRSNPYGASVADNQMQTRETMAREDPRHRGLFGAAWAVGVLGSTIGSSVEALCLAAPAGPFGVAYERQNYPQPGYDDGIGTVYPMFNVVRFARQLAGGNRLSFHGLPDGLTAYGASTGNTNAAMIANVSNQPKTVRLARKATLSILDRSTFDAAVSDVHWLDNAPDKKFSEVELDPYAIGFAKWRS